MPSVKPYSTVYGEVSKVDAENYTAQVKLHPLSENNETGPLPILADIYGMLQLPQVGDIVKVDLMMNDLNHGVISGRVYNKKNNVTIKAHPDNDIHTGKADPGWTIFRHRESGLEIQIKDTGEYKIFTPDSIIMQARGELDISTGQKITIQSDADITINSTDIKLGTGNYEQLVQKGHIDNNYNDLVTKVNAMFSALVFIDALFGGAYTALLTSAYTPPPSLETGNYTTETKAN